MFSRLALAVTLAGAAAPAFGATFESLADFDATKAYDFIIVGAGAGGSTTANRLSENPDFSVLLVEAGGANDGDITVDVPLLCTRLTPNTLYDWNYTTTAQPGLNNRVVPFPTGIGLGGSTTVNCLVYTRGSKNDIDAWAELSGDDGWSWDNMLQYFKKSERYNDPRDGHDATGQYLPEFHSRDGVIGVSVPGYPYAIDKRVMATTEQLEEFPFREDMNSGEQTGIGYVQALVLDGKRSSAKDHLTGPAASRDNLDILLHTRVSRVTSDGSSSDGETLSFNNIEVSSANGGDVQTLTASKEVILSAGAVGTPNILLHSGIGEAAFLESLNIDVLVDLPSVGKNLTDHIGVSTTYIVNETDTLDSVVRNETLFNYWLDQWKANQTGMFVDTSENHAAFLRIADNSSLWESYEDPSSGPLTAHYEWIFQSGLSSYTEEGNYINLPAACVSPLSRGNVSINTTDPFAPPLVNPNLLAEELDMKIVREAIRAGRRFFAAPAWDGVVLGELNNNAESDEDLEDYIRNNAVSFFHPVSTSSMSPVDADYGVTNPDLTVKKVKGLRIVDAGVIPRLPAAHTSASTYALAERAADLIKAAYA
ncbi:GMC oxidoreductase [Cylindrobasidium torrendii FP15055 ss-10]|uniref:GMC oxidoreductase n=1 Tax=Cylindrobasidium torrendii FP15055 ss-10 TaxID=1314674 RepID=A0A0D7BFG9_9AGAR|nr:GMC oxidoreductase [Cylindrobasidium torrendii FP15055 ss-10]